MTGCSELHCWLLQWRSDRGWGFVTGMCRPLLSWRAVFFGFSGGRCHSACGNSGCRGGSTSRRGGRRLTRRWCQWPFPPTFISNRNRASVVLRIDVPTSTGLVFEKLGTGDSSPFLECSSPHYSSSSSQLPFLFCQGPSASLPSRHSLRRSWRASPASSWKTTQHFRDIANREWSPVELCNRMP